MSKKSVPVEVVAFSADDGGNVKFRLRASRIVEICDSFKWYTTRSRIAAALALNANRIVAGLDLAGHRKAVYIFRANRSSIQIGCMRFSGENAKTLRLWAEGKRA